MAHQVYVVDDFDGVTKAKNVTFSIGDDVWDIDLSAANERRLRKLVKEFTDAGRLRVDGQTPEPVPVIDPEEVSALRAARKAERAVASKGKKKSRATSKRTRPRGPIKRPAEAVEPAVASPDAVAPATTADLGADAPNEAEQSSSTDGVDAAVVRQWAVENNIDVPARGRVPSSLVERYLAEVA